MAGEVTAPKKFISFNVDDWVRSRDRRCAEFSANTNTGLSGGRIKCTLTCYHNGNYVNATAFSDVCGDAFVHAVEQIEKTIGQEWRHAR